MMFQRGSISDDQLKLRMEITQLLKEASALSTQAIRIHLVSCDLAILVQLFSSLFPPISDSFQEFVCRPSTFAQAAKLKRLAAAKEKELAKSKSSILGNALENFEFLNFFVCRFTFFYIEDGKIAPIICMCQYFLKKTIQCLALASVELKFPSILPYSRCPH